jgi:hypothetical protein
MRTVQRVGLLSVLVFSVSQLKGETMADHNTLCTKRILGAEQIYSRNVSTQGDLAKLVFDPDLPADAAWTVGFQETGSGTGQVKLTYRRNLVELTQNINLGKFGGDLITGVGSFRMELTGKTGGVDVNINAFWTLQPKLIDVGIFQTSQSITSGAASQTALGDNEGFIPFPFNTISIFSTAGTFRLGMESQTGTLDIMDMTTITQPSTYIIDLQVPPMAKVLVDHTTGVNQTFTTVYSRK